MGGREGAGGRRVSAPNPAASFPAPPSGAGCRCFPGSQRAQISIKRSTSPAGNSSISRIGWGGHVLGAV